MLKLFNNEMLVCAQKVRLVLEYKKLNRDSEHLNLRAGDQLCSEFLQEVFADPMLMPADLAMRAKVRAWLIKLDVWWQDKPGISAWLERIEATSAYQVGIAESHNLSYIALMADKGGEAWPTIETLIKTWSHSIQQ